MSLSNGSISDHVRSVQNYYNSFESKVGYRLVLGDTRHFGYYESDWSFPLFIRTSLRQMEAKLFQALDLKRGATVLDAGCGFGHVALYMANHGLNVVGIDIVDRHIRHAKTLIANKRMQDSMSVRRMDYHDLGEFTPATFDGAYTMETLVHAKDPAKVLQQFYQVLKPDGVLVMHEYDHADESKVPKHIRDMNTEIDKNAATPGYTMFDFGVLESLLSDAGFVDIEVKDFTKNVMPMIWLFYLLAIVPYMILSIFGLQSYLVNMFSGVGFYRGRKWFRYIQVKARKPVSASRAKTDPA